MMPRSAVTHNRQLIVEAVVPPPEVLLREGGQHLGRDVVAIQEHDDIRRRPAMIRTSARPGCWRRKNCGIGNQQRGNAFPDRARAFDAPRRPEVLAGSGVAPSCPCELVPGPQARSTGSSARVSGLNCCSPSFTSDPAW